MENCEDCGSPLPTHLSEIVGDGFRSVGRCEAAYVVRDGKFVRDGTEVNPFARHDGAVIPVKR